MKARRQFKHLHQATSQGRKGELGRWVGVPLVHTAKITFTQLGLRLDRKKKPPKNVHTQKKGGFKTVLTRWKQTRDCLRSEDGGMLF